MSHSRNFRRNIFYSVASQGIVFGLTFAYHILISRNLGATELGVFTLLILTPMLLGRFAHLGIDAASSYYVGDSDDLRNKVISNSIGLCVAAFLLILMGFAIYVSFFDSFIYRRFDMALALSVIASSSVLRTLFFAILVGQNRLRAHAFFGVVDALLPVAITIVLYISSSLNVDNLIWTQMSSGLVVALGMAILVCRNMKFRLSHSFFRISLSYGLKSWLNNVFNQLIYKVDLYIIGYLLTTTDVGVYSISVLVVEKAWYFSSSICNSLFPIVKKLDVKEGAAFVLKVVRYNLVFVTLACVGLALLAKPLIVFLFSAEYLPSVGPLLLLIPGIIALSTPKILVSHLAAQNKLEYAAISSGSALMLNIGLNFGLIPRFGINGAAIASSISYVFYWLLYAKFYRKLTGINTLKVFS